MPSIQENYLEYIQRTADWVAARINPAKGVQIARDTLQVALNKAREATDPDVAVAMATEAWSKFAATPAVAKFLQTTEPVTKPVTKLSYQAFVKIHDTLVASPMYKTALDTTRSTLSFAATTTPYKLGAQYLYPLVQPVADPTISKVSNSKVFHAVVDYWKPVAPVAAH